MRVAILGLGAVGEACAHVLTSRGVARSLVLANRSLRIAHAIRLDLEQSRSWTTPLSARAVAPWEPGAFRGCDVIVLTAGPRLRGEESRAQKAEQTARLLTNGDQSSIVSALANHAQAAGDACPVLLVVTNPVEATVTWLAEQTGWPGSRILGLGTTVETARFSRLLADKLDVDAASVWTEIIGEHGPDIDVRDRPALEKRISEIGTAHVDIDDMLRQTRMAASQIRLLSESEGQARTGRVIAQLEDSLAPAQLPEPVRSALLGTLPPHLSPPATRFAIAAAVSAVIEAIASDGGRILTVSGLLVAALPGLERVALALPFVLGRSGIVACAAPRPPSQVIRKAAASISEQVIAMRAIRQA